MPSEKQKPEEKLKRKRKNKTKKNYHDYGQNGKKYSWRQACFPALITWFVEQRPPIYIFLSLFLSLSLSFFAYLSLHLLCMFYWLQTRAIVSFRTCWALFRPSHVFCYFVISHGFDHHTLSYTILIRFDLIELVGIGETTARTIAPEQSPHIIWICHAYNE